MSVDRAQLERRLRRLAGGADPPADAGRWVPGEALRAAASDYSRSHAPDDAPGDDRRRFRWAVPWRAAGAVALAVALVVGAAVLRSVALSPGSAVELPEPAPLSETPGEAEPGEAGSTPAPAPTATAVVVHVVGAVASPGVVRLPAGARVVDALDAAGGATGEADLARVNLARVLVDGEQVVVPRPGEAVPVPGVAPAADGLVDLNTASLAQLDELPGVGPVLAQRIVDRRPYTAVDELDEVSGIGPTLLERIRPLVRV